MPSSVVKATETANAVFTMYFLSEMIIRITGLGPHPYISDGYNVYDGTVTIIGVIDVVLLFSNISPRSPGTLSIFRCLRLPRVFRLAHAWKSLRSTINVLISSISSVFWLTVLLFLFLFITGLFGMTVSILLLNICKMCFIYFFFCRLSLIHLISSLIRSSLATIWTTALSRDPGSSARPV